MKEKKKILTEHKTSYHSNVVNRGAYERLLFESDKSLEYLDLKGFSS